MLKFLGDRTLADLWEAVRFGLVGLSSAAVYAVVASVCVKWIGAGYVTASVIGYLCAIPINFIAQKRFTFRSAADIKSEIVPYLLVQGVNVVLSAIALSVLAEQSGSLALAILGVIATVTLSTYLLMKLVVFRAGQDTSTRDRAG